MRRRYAGPDNKRLGDGRVVHGDFTIRTIISERDFIPRSIADGETAFSTDGRGSSRHGPKTFPVGPRGTTKIHGLRDVRRDAGATRSLSCGVGDSVRCTDNGARGGRVGVREKTRRTRRVHVMFQQARPAGGELEKKSIVKENKRVLNVSFI